MSDKACDCGTRLVSSKAWLTLTAEQRQARRAEGFNRAATTGQCQRCYQREWYAAKRRAAGHEPGDKGREGPPRTTLLAELDHLDPTWRNRPVLTMCRETAPRLGMRPEALERRLYRYGFRSRFGHDGQLRRDAA